MAAALTTTASAGLRASSSSVVCRCSMAAAKGSNKQHQRTFSTTTPSSSSHFFGKSTRNSKTPSQAYTSELKRSASDPGKNVRNQTGQSIRQFHASNKALAAKNPYTVLGVDKSAKLSDIKKKYYQLAKQYHPDTNKDAGAKARFVEIQEAYDTLGDDKKRALYDKYGAAAQQPGFNEEAYARASSSFGGHSGFGGFADMFGGGGGAGPGGASASDIFEQMFGGSFSSRPGSARAGSSFGPGEDIQETVRVSFMDACKGTKRTVEISPVVDCGTCTGSGLKPGAKKQTCKTCGGSGQRQIMIQNGFVMATTCNVCGGSGSTTDPKDTCTSCGGNGKVRTKKKVDIEIPAGVEDGMRIFMAGMGDAPLEGKGRPGDLQIRIEVAPSRTFRRQGANIYIDKAIPFSSAILGGKIKIPTLDEDITIKVPPGTQPGDDLVLRDKGVPKLHRGDRGDLFVHFNVTIPRSLTKRQRALLEEFVAEGEGLPTRRFIDTADPEETARLAQTVSSRSTSSADSQPTKTSESTDSSVSSSTSKEPNPTDAEKPREGPSQGSRSASVEDQYVPLGSQYEARPPHLSEADVEGQDNRPHSLWEGLKGSIAQWLQSRK